MLQRHHNELRCIRSVRSRIREYCRDIAAVAPNPGFIAENMGTARVVFLVPFDVMRVPLTRRHAKRTIREVETWFFCISMVATRNPSLFCTVQRSARTPLCACRRRRVQSIMAHCTHYPCCSSPILDHEPRDSLSTPSTVLHPNRVGTQSRRSLAFHPKQAVGIHRKTVTE